jgi:hypothetical protein
LLIAQLRFPLVGAAVTAFSMVVASTASASIVTVTVDGAVSSGFDTSGVFGGGNLASDPFQAVFTFDTSVPATSLSSPSTNFIFGGTSIPSVSPSLGASITINGDTATIAGSYYGEIWASSGNFEQIDTAYDASSNVNGYDNNTITIDSYGLGLQPGTINQLIPTTSVYGNGLVQIDNGNYTTHELQNAYAYLAPSSITETVAVPESSTWTIMLAGMVSFGGLVLHRRRKQLRANLVA